MNIETQHELTLPLNPEQAMHKATMATERMKALQKFDEEYGIIKREKNKERKEMNNEIRNLINDFSSKTTTRNVKCTKVLDLESGDKWYIYDGEEYGREAMSVSDIVVAQQPELGLSETATVEHSDSEDNHADGIFDPQNVPHDDVFEPAALSAVE